MAESKLVLLLRSWERFFFIILIAGVWKSGLEGSCGVTRWEKITSSWSPSHDGIYGRKRLVSFMKNIGDSMIQKWCDLRSSILWELAIYKISPIILIRTVFAFYHRDFQSVIRYW